jgi:tRNA (guanine37-N1)-methyltransferase
MASVAMEFHIITLFPEMFESPFRGGMVGRAIEQGIIVVKPHPLRPFGLGNYKQVDDQPYGGGSGMVMRPEPIAAAIDAVMGKHPQLRRILMTPQGAPLTQEKVRELAARKEGLLLIAGRYEGVDERVRAMVDEEISIGDYVLSGGELPAMALIEAVARLQPGVLGNPDSIEEESFSAGLLEYPQYTRPEDFRGMRVPEVLLSGDHGKIRAWREEQARRRTAERRPDLLGRRKP